MKILLLGSTGFLGSYLSEALKKNNINFSISTRDDFIMNDSSLNFTDSLSLKIKSCDICINCVANTNFSNCELTGNEDIANIKIPKLIADTLKKNQHVFHLSSDIFYENQSNFSNESGNLVLNNWYAKQKLLSEKAFYRSNSTILRTSFVGINNRETGLDNHIFQAIKKKEPINGWQNVYSSTVHVEHVVSLILKLLNKEKISGIFNYGTISAYSKKDYIKSVLNNFGCIGLLNEISYKPKNIKRNFNSGMDSNKIHKTFNIEPPEFGQVVDISSRHIEKKLNQL